DLRLAELALQRAEGVRLVALGDEALDGERAGELLAGARRAGQRERLRQVLRRTSGVRLCRRDAGAADEHEGAGERGREGGQAIPGQWDLLKRGLGLGRGCPAATGPENRCARLPTLASVGIDGALRVPGGCRGAWPRRPRPAAVPACRTARGGRSRGPR